MHCQTIISSNNRDLLILELEYFWNQWSMVKHRKLLRPPANAELAQTVACRALKLEALGSISTGGNILQLDFLFSRDFGESTKCTSIKEIFKHTIQKC